ncbi:MAG: extracellular matrix regulator RemB [Bacillota bacterium]
MLVNIGGEAVLRSREIIGLFDLETVGDSPITKEFLDLIRTEGTAVDLSGGNPKSVILTSDKVYLTTVSIGTIRKRATLNDDLEEKE